MSTNTIQSPILSADAAGTLVTNEAEVSAGLFCYGVGGALVENATGRIIYQWGNRAQNKLKSGEFYPYDPTNHGETQIVRWYYDHQESIRQDLGYLPKPQELTVFTSLDPCAMCAGGLCAAGFNVGVVAPDESDGGVNWAADGQFRHMPLSIQNQLKRAFGYYKAEGIDYRNQYEGNPDLLFSTETLSQRVFESSLNAFTNSQDRVGNVRRNTRIDLADLKNPQTLSENDPTVQALKTAFPEALTIRLTEKIDTSASGFTPKNNVYYRPNEELRRKLQEAVEKEPGAENAVAIIDPYGNLLAIGVDKPTKSPVATSLMNASSDYSRFLFKLISEASDPNKPEKYKRGIAYNYLAPTRNSTFIYLKSPSAEQAQTLKDLGAFESSNGGIIQYIEAPRFGTKIDFEQHARALPLYYRSGSSATTPMQSTPEELNIIVWNGNNAGPGSLREAINTANRANSYRKIVIASQDPIKLLEPLPLITSPVDIRPAEGNPKAIINFNSNPGLQFSKSASGSSLADLQLKEARLFGINTDTHWLQFENLSFIPSPGNLRGLNLQNVSIKNPLPFKGPNLEGWNNPIAKLTTPGLQFSKSASGSSLAHLQLKEARLFGINTDTHWLQFENLSFAPSPGNLRGLNLQNVSIKNPLQFKGQNLEGWNNPIAKLTNTYIINDRAIKINANTSLISANRLDTEPETIEFSFLNQKTQETTTPRVFLGSSIGSLTSAHIEKAFSTGQLKANPESGTFSVLGDQFVKTLTSGNWVPKAKLADGPELSLTWIEQSGTVINAEFKLLLKTAKHGKPEHLDLIGKTYKFTYDIANPGNNIRAQKGELGIRAIQTKSLPITLGFYEVSDPLTGIVSGFSPGQQGYAEAAMQRAQKDNLLISELPSSGQRNANQAILLQNMDPNKSYGMLIHHRKDQRTNETFTSYQQPKDGELYQFRSFALSNNRAAVGVEVDFRSSQGDFADLVFTLPDNINMIQSGWA